jgi:hypothetical protein
MIEFQIDGQNYRFPDWVTESTGLQMRDLLKELAKKAGVDDKNLNAILKAQQEAVQELADGNKDGKKTVDEQKKRDEKLVRKIDDMVDGLDEVRAATEKIELEVPKSFRDKLADSLEADGEVILGSLGGVAEKLVKVGGVMGGALLGGAGYVGSKLMEAGDTVNSLVKSGIGFNQTFASVGGTATTATAQLGALGLGFSEAAELMKANSNVIATQGFKRFDSTMKFAADTSEELGMSFSDSMETFAEALSTRQRLLDLSGVNQTRLNSQIAKTTKIQTVYATALGQSVDEIQAFVDGLLYNNGTLTASILRFSNTVRSDLVAGLEVFAGGLRAMGGKSGESIADAFVEAGAKGAIGLSDAAIGLVTALPNLAGPMNEFISGVQNGTLSQDQANDMVQGLTSNLGNLSSTEKERIRLLARAGDESAQMLSQSIAQFEQSEKKLKDINKQLGIPLNMDLVQKGRNEFAKVLAQAGGMVESTFFTLFADPGVTKALMDGVKEIMGVFGIATDDMSGLRDNAKEFAKNLAEKAIPIIKSVAASLKEFAEYLRDTFQEGGISGVIGDLMSKAAGAVVKALFKGLLIFGTMLFAASAAKVAFMTYVMPSVKDFAVKMFQGSAGAGKFLFDKAKGWMGGLFDPKSSGKLAKFAQSSVGFIKEKASGFAGSDTGKNIAGKLSTFQKDGAKMTENLSKSVTGGGKSGGFLKSIADGVSKFGDTKVVKGAASLALLGGAVVLAAIGLKTFNEVDFTSIIKGTIALGGLAMLAQTLGKGSTAMMKGAAAVAILGASVIPLAVGLNIMKDVGIGTIGVLAAGLITLGVAAAAMGSFLPLILMGAVAIGALGVAIIPFALAANLLGGAMESISAGLQTIADLPILEVAGSLLVLGATFTMMLPFIPGLLLTGVALGLMGIALIPFAFGAALAAKASQGLPELFEALAQVNWINLLMAAPALLSLAAGMMALSAGGLVSGLLDGLGKLFGSESPFDKLATLSQNAKHIVEMSKEMRNMSSTMGQFESALEAIDANKINDKFVVIADGIYVMVKALESLGMGSMAKLVLLKSMGVMPQAQAPAKQKSPAPIGFGMNNEEDPFADMQGAKQIKKEGGVVTMRDGKPVELSPEQQQRVQAARDIKQIMSGSAKMPDRQSQSVDPKAVPVTGQRELIGPEIPSATGPTQTNADMVGPKKPDAPQDMSQHYLEQMVALQHEQIKLLKKQVKATGEIDI